MKADIKKDIQQGLDSGLTHQEVFDSLKQKYAKDGKLLTTSLLRFPIPKRKEKLKFLWVFLLLFLFGVLGLRLLAILLGPYHPFNFQIIVFTLSAIVGIGLYEKYAFQFLGLLGIGVGYIVLAPVWFDGQVLHILGILSILFIIGACIASYILFFKLFVTHRIEKVLVEYENGRQGFEVHAKFIE